MRSLPPTVHPVHLSDFYTSMTSCVQITRQLCTVIRPGGGPVAGRGTTMAIDIDIDEGAAPARTTEQRILEAGLQLWIEESPSVIFGGFNVARVAKAAGVTRATFYSYWSSTDAYLESLLRYLGERVDVPGTVPAAGPFEEIPEAAHDVVAQFMIAARKQLQHAIGDPALRARFGFASKLDDPEVADALRTLYRTSESRFADRHRNIRVGWGREPRPPFTDEHIEAIFSMLLDGVAMRHMIDPESMPIDSFGQIGLMVLILTTRVIDDPRSIEDMVGIINQWPTAGTRINTERRIAEARTREPLSADAMQIAVATARRMLAEANWNEITIDEIALAVGIDADRILSTFGSKPGLALAILAQCGDEVWSETPRTGDALADLRTLLDILIAEVRRSPALGQSAIQILAGGTRLPNPAVIAAAPIPDITRLLVEAHAAGQIRQSLDPHSLALSVTRILMAEGVPATFSGLTRVDSLHLLLDGISTQR